VILREIVTFDPLAPAFFRDDAKWEAILKWDDRCDNPDGGDWHHASQR
jgi:hypothetical protein